MPWFFLDSLKWASNLTTCICIVRICNLLSIMRANFLQKHCTSDLSLSQKCLDFFKTPKQHSSPSYMKYALTLLIQNSQGIHQPEHKSEVKLVSNIDESGSFYSLHNIPNTLSVLQLLFFLKWSNLRRKVSQLSNLLH